MESQGGGNDPRAAAQVGLGVRTSGTSRTVGQGELTVTSNATDVAILGNGYFRAQLASGEQAYTRAGNFTLDASGRLVTQHGQVVEPGITIPADFSNLTIEADGTVEVTLAGASQPTQLGKIQLYTFTNPGGLSSIGDNLVQPTSGSGEALTARAGENGAGTLAEGQLEGSNVKAVEEMIDMIAAQRAYELNSKVIQSADQMLQKLTSLR